MTNVTTRPKKAATPVAVAVTSVTAPRKPSKTVEAAEPNATEATNWRELFRAVRAKVCPILSAVQDRLQDSGNAESGYRLPCIAEMMLDDTNIDILTLDDPLIYNIVALIRSAMGTPGEEIDDVSRALLGQALYLVETLMFAMTETPSADDVAAVTAALDAPIAGPLGDAEERREICRQALSELADWIGLIEREHEHDDFQNIRATVFNRSDTLCSVILSALEDETEPATDIGARLTVEPYRHCVRGEA